MDKAAFAEALNHYGGNRTPCFFLIDFEMQKPVVMPLDECASRNIFFNINGFGNLQAQTLEQPVVKLIRHAPLQSLYLQQFNQVYRHLLLGDSFLTNLTIRTKIEISNSLQELFHISRSRYKLLYQDEFLTFSPETFIRMQDQKIFAYPMKGTIDAGIPQARQRILSDPKEMAEHVTIVDLIRNDLSQVASGVHVSRFRYIDEINTQQKQLLQVSSVVEGVLSDDYRNKLGDILLALLPAGSVSGAPKPKTLEVIAAAEGEPRGYYTGVFGYFDGRNLDSAVIIRYIENRSGEYFYRSGGGITTQSEVEKEFQEALDKIYVPVD
ncbi:MAG: aminodeoxychorismate synthase component I [Cyclobacteriaceae bacterium]|jgi:para-aminobenzoate synthetase component 1|nr:aminodeoxychorismate synthase component I [Cyclobacteriaceae bacterium]